MEKVGNSDMRFTCPISPLDESFGELADPVFEFSSISCSFPCFGFYTYAFTQIETQESNDNKAMLQTKTEMIPSATLTKSCLLDELWPHCGGVVLLW